MENQNFTTVLLSDQSPRQVFNAVKNPKLWWSGIFSGEIKGNTEKLNDEFIFRAGEGMHYSKQKLVEVIEDKKIVWLVTESKLTFLKKEDEWTGTKVIFEISKKGSKTQLRFTHEGLAPEVECYEQCSAGWNTYIKEKLVPLLN